MKLEHAIKNIAQFVFNNNLLILIGDELTTYDFIKLRALKENNELILNSLNCLKENRKIKTLRNYYELEKAYKSN
jgi:16S rRNA G527 N7-methylase RsmG